MNGRYAYTHSQIAMSLKLVPGFITEMPCVSDFDFFKENVESVDLFETEIHKWFRQWMNQKEKLTTIESILTVFCPNI